MKSLLLLTTFLCLITISSSAQLKYKHSFSFALGAKHKSLGSKIPCDGLISFQIDRRISKLSIGFIVAAGEFQGYKEEYAYTNTYVVTGATGELTILGLRANYYLIEKDRFDIYAGAMLSFIASTPLYLETEYVNTPIKQGTWGTNSTSSSNGFKGGFQVGGHYWIRPRFGILCELNYGTALFNVGITYRR